MFTPPSTAQQRQRPVLTGSDQNSQHARVLSSSHVVSDILQQHSSQGRVSTAAVEKERRRQERVLTSPIMTASDGLQPSSDRACVETPARVTKPENLDLRPWEPASDLCEERLLWLAHHQGSAVSSVLQARHKGPGTEGQTVLAPVVAALVDGDERSSIQDQPEVKQN